MSIEMLIKRELICFRFEKTEPIQSNKKQLNLVKNHNEVYVRVASKVTIPFISQEIANWQRKLYNISIKRPFMEELS